MQQKLLIIEDDPTSTEIMRICLKSQGYDLTFATNGKAAYEIALLLIPDLILMDVNMPGWDGFETCRVFKSNKLLVNIPIIFVTGAINNDIEKAFSAGGADYVIKPLNSAELHMRIGFHLERMKFVKEIKKLNSDSQRTIQEKTAELAAMNRKLVAALEELQQIKKQ
jgi:DNA-binding response OmpR family regulator